MVARSIDRTADARLPGAPSYAIYAQIQGSILIAPLPRSLSLQLKSHDLQAIGKSESTESSFTKIWTVDASGQ